jgi:Membrane-associated phospholipid phosphatase
MEWLLNLDRYIFIFVNGFHCPFMDSVMVFFTNANSWIPLYILLLLYIIYRFSYKEKRYIYTIALVAAIVLTFTFTDILSAQIKELVQRLRPGHDPTLEGIVRLLDGKGGLYGFPSSHAANVFGLAMITALSFKVKWYSIVIYVWAFLVSYSRLYVGRHFLLDVICGAALGILIAYLLHILLKLLVQYMNSRKKKVSVT